jgi:archaellum component FlaC
MPDNITFKIYFKSDPQIITFNNMGEIYDSSFLKIVNAQKQKEDLEKSMQEIKTQLERITDNIKRFKELEDHIKSITPDINEFIAKVKENIAKNTDVIKTHNLKNIEDKVFSAFAKCIIENGN